MSARIPNALGATESWLRTQIAALHGQSQLKFRNTMLLLLPPLPEKDGFAQWVLTNRPQARRGVRSYDEWVPYMLKGSIDFACSSRVCSIIYEDWKQEFETTYRENARRIRATDAVAREAVAALPPVLTNIIQDIHQDERTIDEQLRVMWQGMKEVANRSNAVILESSIDAWESAKLEFYEHVQGCSSGDVELAEKLNDIRFDFGFSFCALVTPLDMKCWRDKGPDRAPPSWVAWFYEILDGELVPRGPDYAPTPRELVEYVYNVCGVPAPVPPTNRQ